MLSISAGSDPRYLTREVGAGAEHYYLRSIDLQGEPPGYWAGAGAIDLGLEGEVSNEVFEDLYTRFIDPRKRDEMYARLEAIPYPKDSEEYAKAEQRIRKDARLGDAPRNFEKAFEKRFAQALERARERTPGGVLSPEQVKAIELATRKEAPSAKLYYDLTFSAPKSWSVYHASLQVKAAEAREAGDLETAQLYSQQAEEVWECWKAGVQAGLAHMQDEAGYTRKGHHGPKIEERSTGEYVKADRFIVAAFAQHTSREDDPQLHVHAAVLNKVRCIEVDPVTGREREVWRALDGTGLWRHKQAAGHLAERVAEQELERRLGVRVQMRPDGKAREIVGIDQELRDQFSSRRVAIKAEVAAVARAFEEKYGAAPSPYLLARMSEDISLQQRKAKKHDAVTRDQLLARWEQASQARFRESLANVPDQVASESALLDLHRPATEWDPAVVQRRAIAVVQEAKPTWTRPDLIVELNRQLPDTLGGLEPEQVRALINQLADEALSPATDNGVVCTKAPSLVEIPAELQRADGTFVYEPNPKTFDRYATEEHIRTEERLKEFAGRRGAPTVPDELVEAVIRRRGLQGGQAEFVRQAATSGRRVDLLVGPAGAGKSYTLAALTEVWEAYNDGMVIGLASGQRAAEVLRDEGIENVANIDMLLIANKSLAEGRPIQGAERYRIPSGALVIVDEAGMTNTQDLDAVRALVEASGAKMVPAGDHHQLTSVGAGGMFAQWVDEAPGVHVLDEVRRFRDVDPITGEKATRQWEADASLQLRDGDTEALTQYEMHGRFRGGSAEEMTNRAYQAWMADYLAGRNPLLIATDNAQVAELSARVRADLVRAGLVEDEGVELRTGREEHGVVTKAGRGDLIQLRRNNRQIVAENGAFAVNRTVATVTGIGDDGAMTVRLQDGAEMHLPAAYVKEHVELAYASTVHGAQGRTVGVCHAVVDQSTNREALYVMLTRGEAGNFGYVVTHRPEEGVKEEDVPHHLAVLDAALQRTGLEATATTTVAAELERRENLAVLAPTWAGVKEQDAARRFGQVLLETLGEERYNRLTTESAYGSLLRLARQVEEHGFDARDLLARTAQAREVDTAEQISKVLHHRLTNAYQKAERAQIRAEQAEQKAAVARQEADVQATVEATHVQGIDAETLTQLTLTPASEEQEPVHPHQEELLRQALSLQTGLQVAHAGQDEEVRQRQAAEREARWEAMDSYTARTPQLDGDLGRFMTEWAAEMDARTERLGQRIAEQQPAWAIERLGPVPQDPIERAEWEKRAGRVERYREAHGWSDERNAIGQAPPPGAVEARADWERARRALGVDEREADIARAADETLRQMIERAEREEQWAPPYVADDMQKAYRAERDFGDQAVQLRINAQRMAEQEAAEHEERVTDAVYGVQTATGYNEHQQALAQAMALQQAPTLQAEVDPSEQVRQIEDRAQTSQEIAEQMGARAQQLREVHETREKWVAETQQVRDEAELARAELERRVPEPQVEESDARQAESSSPSATGLHNPEMGAAYDLERALEIARQAQLILEERARQREIEQEAARVPQADREQVEETERSRRDEGFQAAYARIGQDLAQAERDIEAPGYSASAPGPRPATPAPDLGTEPGIGL